jgi:LysM repeat protein
VRRLALVFAVPALALVLAGAAAAAVFPKYQIAGLQVALYRYGHYHGEIDGVAGPMTEKAIRDFQRSAGLQADGVAGKQTRIALGRYGRPLFGVRTLRRGKIGYDVSVLQFLLAKNGFPPKRLNSNFGPVTEALVRKFQRKAGLPADGIVGKLTRAALLGEKPAVAKPKRRRVHARHLVHPGETLTSIAERHGTTVRALAQSNRMDPSDVLLIGVRLLVPNSSGVAADRSSVVGSINHWAAHYGVDPNLARALAWQESGFQSHVLSSVGAGGVIRIGVAYLDHLLGQFDGDVRRALGAYYQGPAAVRDHGLFPTTRRFVANVLALRGRV